MSLKGSTATDLSGMAADGFGATEDPVIATVDLMGTSPSAVTVKPDSVSCRRLQPESSPGVRGDTTGRSARSVAPV
jgi:hypothetical protein